jgi:uncharacterized protein YraI
MKTSLKSIRSQLTKVSIAALLVTVILAGCGPAATPVTPTPVPPTPVPPTAVPTAVPPTAAPPTAVPPTVAPTVAADPMYYSNEPTAVVPAGVPGQPMVEAAVNTVIMGGPGTNYVVYGAFLGGVTAIATGVSEDGIWYAISVPVAAGGIGWVSSYYVIASDTSGLPVLPTPPVPPTVELVPPAEGDPQAIALTQVYVRSGPADTYPAYGIAQTNAVGRVLGKSQDGTWLVIRLDPQVVGLGYGWVATAYTQPSNIENVPVIAAPEAPPPVTTTPPPAGAATATAIDYVNLRSGPGTEYLILGTAAPGATSEVTGKSEDGLWWQVKVPTSYYAPGAAWVSVDWVYTTNTSNVPVVAAPPPPSTEVPTTPPPASQCVLVSQDPADGTTFPTSTGFGVTWVLQNTSSQPWNQDATDLVFLGAINGQRLHQNGDYYDITQTVEPGQNYTVNGSLITPSTPGQYGEAWSIMSGSTTLCTFWIIVNAQ